MEKYKAPLQSHAPLVWVSHFVITSQVCMNSPKCILQLSLVILTCAHKHTHAHTLAMHVLFSYTQALCVTTCVIMVVHAVTVELVSVLRILLDPPVILVSGFVFLDTCIFHSSMVTYLICTTLCAEVCNPACLNGGTCHRLSSTSVHCDCPSGYYGSYCQHEGIVHVHIWHRQYNSNRSMHMYS